MSVTTIVANDPHADLNDLEVDEAIANDRWLLTDPDVELPDAERERLAADLDSLLVTQRRRDGVHDARANAQMVIPCPCV